MFLGQLVSTDDPDLQYPSPFLRMRSILTEEGRLRPHEFWLQDVAARSVVLKESVVEHQRIITSLEVQRHNL